MGLKLVIVAGRHLRTRLGLALENAGHDVTEFSTVDGMLAELARHSPDVLLVDLTPKGTDGIGCVREVRTIRWCCPRTARPSAAATATCA